MATAREIMHVDVQGVRPGDTLAVAAATMRDLHVGSLPVINADGGLRGIITDRDIVVRCVAEGRDPQTTTAQELVKTAPIWVDADDDVSVVLESMEQNKIRRVPVIEDDRLVGIISEANIATNLGTREVGEFATAVYSAPPNN
jgi:CBS domain-containing protein